MDLREDSFFPLEQAKILQASRQVVEPDGKLTKRHKEPAMT
jgi:hypothetical protein